MNRVLKVHTKLKKQIRIDFLHSWKLLRFYSWSKIQNPAKKNGKYLPLLRFRIWACREDAHSLLDNAPSE